MLSSPQNSRRFWFGRCIALVLLASTLGSSAGQAQSKRIRMITKPITPFVIQDGAKLSGFSIDLWNSIAGELKIQTEFVVKPSVPEAFQALSAGRGDGAIAALSITSEREQKFDFSQPMFASGLQIMLRKQDAGSGGGGGGNMPSFLRVVFGRSAMEMLGIMLLLTIIPAHIVWFTERKKENGILESTRYFPGILKAYWWAAGTLGAQADEMPRSWVGRFVAVAWMFTSIVFVAYFTAAVTASLTVEQLQGNIKGPNDLPGKQVAATRGSTAASYLKSIHANVTETNSIEDAFKELEEKRADAVVFDSPALLYYAARGGKGSVEVIGKIFREENYGIAFPPDSPLRKDVNLTLLKLRENGTYQKLYDKWFGDDGK